MPDDLTAEIAAHAPGTMHLKDGTPICRGCRCAWPCLVRRLADALEAQRRMLEREHAAWVLMSQAFDGASAALEAAERRAERYRAALVERDHFPHAHPTQRDYVTCRLCEESAESRDAGAISHKLDCLLAPPSTAAPTETERREGRSDG